MTTKTTTIVHEISGYNFHGGYHLRLRGPAEGFALSPSQLCRYEAALCGITDCSCGGGYGTGPDPDYATVEWDEYTDLATLVPAGRH